MSVDLGLYPIDTDSSDEDMFTENVWWEAADNLAFVNDEGGPEPEPPQEIVLYKEPIQILITFKTVFQRSPDQFYIVSY